MVCFSCGRGFHDECLAILDNDCCDKYYSQLDNHSLKNENSPKKEVTISAGRKRAAAKYKLDPEARCEWAGLANCGGGLKPIVGCIVGLQQARHHGPIKDPTHNEEENIHRICSSCHNHWHRANDEIYDENLYSTLPHNPKPATPAELVTRGK